MESLFIFHQCEGFVVGGVHSGLCIRKTLVCEEVEFAEFTFAQFVQGKGRWDDRRSAGHGDVSEGKELVAILFYSLPVGLLLLLLPFACVVPQLWHAVVLHALWLGPLLPRSEHPILLSLGHSGSTRRC